jgi:hypothetical protein
MSEDRLLPCLRFGPTPVLTFPDSAHSRPSVQPLKITRVRALSLHASILPVHDESIFKESHRFGASSTSWPTWSETNDEGRQQQKCQRCLPSRVAVREGKGRDELLDTAAGRATLEGCWHGRRKGGSAGGLGRKLMSALATPIWLRVEGQDDTRMSGRGSSEGEVERRERRMVTDPSPWRP